MKLAPLLAQFLYANKRLDLPGIGTFLFDPSVMVEPDNSKNSKPRNIEGVSFESNTSPKETTDLVAFISSQAGKMKALAAADLDSHLQLAKQFLNIGKPFLFEGIGSITKLQSGQYELAAVAENIKNHPAREISVSAPVEESVTGYGSIFYKEKQKTKTRKPVTVLFLLTGIVIAIAGGYVVYKKTSTGNNSPAPIETKVEKTVPVNNNEPTEKKDSLPQTTLSAAIIPAVNQSIQPGNFKFVVEATNKERALERFGTLKGWGLNIQMETKDSANYHLFFILPASVADTTRILDSLSVLYTPPWKKAFTEK